MPGRGVQEIAELVPSAFVPNDANQLENIAIFFKNSFEAVSAALRQGANEEPLPPSELDVDETLRRIDDAVETCDFREEPVLQFGLLVVQAAALLLRAIRLLDITDADRCSAILGTLPPSGDDAHVKPSEELQEFRLLLQESCTPEAKLKLIYGSSNFLPKVIVAYEVARALSDAPSESFDPLYRAQVVEGIESFIVLSKLAIERGEHEVEDPRILSPILLSYGWALQARFLLRGDIFDVDRAISACETSYQLHDATDSDGLVGILAAMRMGLDSRYRRTHDPADLDRRIDVEEIVSYIHNENPQISRSLVHSLLDRLEKGGNLVDGDRALQLCDALVPIVQGEDRSKWLDTRRLVMTEMSEWGRQFPDLGQALERLREQGDTSWDTDPVRATFRSSILDRFLWSQLKIVVVSGDLHSSTQVFREIRAFDFGHLDMLLTPEHVFARATDAELDTTVTNLKQRCSLRPPSDVYIIASTLILILALQERYRRLEDHRDLEEALAFRAPLGPPGEHHHDAFLFSTAVNAKNDLLENGWNFVKSVEFHIPDDHLPLPKSSEYPGRGRQKLDDIPYDDPVVTELQNFVQVVGGFSASSQSRLQYNYFHRDSDFEIAKQTSLLELSKHPHDLPHRHQHLHILSDIHMQRFRERQEVQDLQQAIDYLQQILRSVGDEVKTLEAWRWRVEWATQMFILHQEEVPGDATPKSVIHAELLRAHDYFRDAAGVTGDFVSNRLAAVSKWFTCLFHIGVWEKSKRYVPEMCDHAISLLEEQGWTASGIRSAINARHSLLPVMRNIHVDIATAALVSENSFKAIEVLEAAQSLIWSQALMLRAPLDELASVKPALADRLRRLSSTFEKRIGLSDSCGNENDTYDIGTHPWQLFDRRKRILEEIRGIPTFETFGLPRSYEELRMATSEGPVVLLLGHRLRCIACILMDSTDLILDLPITPSALQNLHKLLKVRTSIRGPRSGHHSAEALSPEVRELSRAGVPKARKKSTEELLEVLWEKIALPVVHAITGAIGVPEGGGGDATNIRIPNRDDRTRIWWCCVGEFSFVPIHAAGVYRGTSPICVSDFFISSYTPSLGALIDARNRPVPVELKVLAAAQPRPGEGWKALHYTKEELHEITQIVRPDSLIHLGGSNKPDIEGVHSTVEKVVKALPSANVLHLACHGLQDASDPLRSAFILAEGRRLTVEELMKHSLPNAYIAILSACHTGSNDPEQSGEGLNLACAMLHLGFRSVVATKWSMDDPDGPIVAKAIYDALFKMPQAGLPSRSLATVIDGVARELRENGASAERWATFVHLGL